MPVRLFAEIGVSTKRGIPQKFSWWKMYGSTRTGVKAEGRERGPVAAIPYEWRECFCLVPARRYQGAAASPSLARYTREPGYRPATSPCVWDRKVCGYTDSPPSD